MDTKKTALNVAGVVFFIVALLHLLRIIFRWEVVIQGFNVPHWYSVVLALVTFFLSLWMFKSIR